MAVKVKRIYDAPAGSDGKRILVDRLWPRGLTKEKAHIDLWLKEIAPSTELRQGFHQGVFGWEEFVKSYKQELSRNTTALRTLKKVVEEGPVTLLTAAKDEGRNHAWVLVDFMEKE